MSQEKITVNMPEGSGNVLEIIHREGSAVKNLDPKPPVKIDLKGTIDAPYEFLLHRSSEPDQINQKRCHIVYSRDNLRLTLVMNENDDYLRGTVTGQIEVHPKFKEFGINSGYQWEPKELGQFLKMNRVFFPSQKENMDLVANLKNFKATIESKMRQETQQNGSETDDYSKVVNSNLPGAFKIKIPLFKGMDAVEIEVEIYASIDGRTVSLQLISPGAVQALEEIRDEIIDDQIARIQEITPDIVIIEQ